MSVKLEKSSNRTSAADPNLEKRRQEREAEEETREEKNTAERGAEFAFEKDVIGIKERDVVSPTGTQSAGNKPSATQAKKKKQSLFSKMMQQQKDSLNTTNVVSSSSLGFPARFAVESPSSAEEQKNERQRLAAPPRLSAALQNEQ